MLLSAHFMVMLPKSDEVNKQNESLRFDIALMHTFEMNYMNIKKPISLGYFLNSKKYDLLKYAKAKKFGGKDGYTLDFRFEREGLFNFFVEPDYYFEPSEGVFLKHYTKVMIQALGISDDYNKPIGLKAEIIPLVRPFGLLTGNIFKGKVLFNGKAVPASEVEISYYNENGAKSLSKNASIQGVLSDDLGEFIIGLPKAGWWVITALIPNDEKIKYKGKEYEVELGATILIKVYDLK